MESVAKTVTYPLMAKKPLGIRRSEQHTAERQLPHWQAVSSWAKKAAVHTRHGDSASQTAITEETNPPR